MNNLNKQNDLKLSGNLFFNFLTESAATHMKKISCDRREIKFNQKHLIEMLKNIIYASKSNNIDSFEQYATKYKNFHMTTFGLLEKLFPNNMNDCIDEFDKKIRNKYHTALCDTYDAIKDIINDDELSIEALVGKCLYVIDRDNTIKGKTEFFVLPGGQPISKAAMIKHNEFDVAAFILGIWHYIVTDSMKGNSTVVGREEQDTYDEMYNSGDPKGAKKKIKQEFQKRLIPNLIVKFDKPINESLQKSSNEDKEKSNDKSNPEIYWLDTYREALKKKYSRITSPLQNNKLIDFYDIYIENNIRPHYRDGRLEEILSDSRLETLKEKFSSRIIITGVAGIGKTMFLKHLLLTAINSEHANDTQLIPFFVSLEDYQYYESKSEDPNSHKTKLQEYIFSCVKSLAESITIENFNAEQRYGKCLFLFDGMERIMRSQIIHCIEEINYLTETYPQNTYIVSSRPFYENVLLYLQDFTIVEVLPFTKKQSMEMITRLTKDCDRQGKIESYNEAFENRLYERYIGINDNPMLLSKVIEKYILPRTGDEYRGTICREICDILLPSMLMSMNKKNVLETKLSREHLLLYFATLCAFSYMEGQHSFTKDKLEMYLNMINLVDNENKRVANDDFIYDITIKAGMMYLKHDRFYFLSNIIQEYFCAKYYLESPVETQDVMNMLFSKEPNHYFSKEILSIIYEIDKNKTELTIFLPYLQKLMEKCKTGKGYWTFLEIIYPQIYYYKSCPPKKTYAFCSNSSPFFLYDFIVIKKGLKGIIDPNQLPYIDDFKINDAPMHSKNICDPVFSIWPFTICSRNEDDPVLSQAKDFYVDHFRIDTKNIHSHDIAHPELIKALFDDDFALKQEYNKIRAYTQLLVNKFS